MRFLVDAQLPPGLARNLQAEGHEAIHVSALLAGDAPDSAVMNKAHELGLVLVTKDEDFADFDRRGLVRTGVLWIRFGNTANAALWQKLKPLLPEIVRAFAAGETLVEIV